VIQDWPLSNGRLIPPVFTPEIAVHFAHRTWAYLVLIAAIAAGVSALRTAGKRSEHREPGHSHADLVVVQTMLGALTIWTHRNRTWPARTSWWARCCSRPSFILTGRCWRYLRTPRPSLPEALRSARGGRYGKAGA